MTHLRAQCVRTYANCCATTRARLKSLLWQFMIFHVFIGVCNIRKPLRYIFGENTRNLWKKWSLKKISRKGPFLLKYTRSVFHLLATTYSDMRGVHLRVLCSKTWCFYINFILQSWVSPEKNRNQQWTSKYQCLFL